MYLCLGFLAGWTLLLDTAARRSVIALYGFVKMFDVTGRDLFARGLLCQLPYLTEVLFIVSNAFIVLLRQSFLSSV